MPITNILFVITDREIISLMETSIYVSQNFLIMGSTNHDSLAYTCIL